MKKVRVPVKKIVFVVPDMAGGGTEHVIALLANEYVKRGIDTAILSFAGSQQAYPLDCRVETVSAGAPSGGSVKVRLQRLAFMRRYFKKNRGCHIFSFSTIGTGFIVLATLGLGRRMLVSERTDPGSCDHKPYRNFFYLFADRLVCQTQDAISCFPAVLQKKACVIGNPLEETLPERYAGERRRSIAAVGRLEPVKNYHMLIEAFGMFEKSHPDYTLDLYGKGSQEEKLKACAASLGLQDKVVFHGFCANVKEAIRDCSMFVLSSDYEGVSNSMLEALAMGIPVIATDCPIGGSRTYIENGKNGLLVSVNNAGEMEKAMTKIADNKELSENLSVNAIEIRKKCAIGEIADAMLSAAGMG